uniref:DUF1985 domain-containing protein n=1 Tax=Nicotiana tabacum TaxID=4097 RepID=A0A1S3ZZM8_TOBAC|nr:PREDICTED: uncharacterized protein LOC107792126 [Nicotiana tabacum]
MAPKDPNAAKVRKAANAPKAPKAPTQPIIPSGPYVPAHPPTRPGQRYFEFRDWLNCKGYWKGNHDLKKLITTFLTPTQRDKLNNGTFQYIMAMENFKCSIKLIYCLCLSRIFTNDRDSISFKIFGHDVSFTLEDFHIMCGLRITTHNVKKPINRESNILKRYFGKSKGVTLKDIRDFMTRNEIPKNVVNHIHVCKSDDDAVKLMEILVVESILFGKKTESYVMEEYASIVEDDKDCAEYPWGNVAYEKLIYSLKHALDKQNKLHSTEYTLGGFPYPLCAWFYERFPDIREKYIIENEYFDTPQVPRMLRYVYVGEPKFPELFDMFSSHERYRSFTVLDIIPTGEELNSMPLIGQLPCSRIRSKRLTMEVQRHAEKERSTIVKEVFDKFKKEERSAIVDVVFVKVKEYFDEKFEQLFKIVNKSKRMDDGNFDLSNYREYDRVNDCYEHPSDINDIDDASDKVIDVNATREEVAFEGDQHVQEQVEEERSSADRLSRDGNDEAELSTENIGSKQGADNQVVETEEHTAHDALRKIAEDNATRKEAVVEGDEHVQQQGGEEQSSVCRQSKDGNDEEVTTEKGADDQVVGTEKHAPSCALESDMQKAICLAMEIKHLLKIITTVEVETNCASIDTTQKLSDDVELNEGRVEKNLPENTPMLLDIGSQLNEAENADIEKDMQPGETTGEDKRQERLEAAQKEFGELMQLYEKGEIHIFTLVASKTGVKCMSSDASQLLPNPKRRKISSSPMCDTGDILNFNLCSFSLGSTQGTDSEGNSAAVVVREERQERREQ